MAWDESSECPLCMEPLDIDDISFFPCTCGYQICRFCWHRIRTDENGLCPACRKQYQEGPAEFRPLTDDELHRIKRERKQKDHQRKQKAAENRRHLANLRVVQKNLVFVVGLSQRLADADTLKKHEYFGRFGKIVKVRVAAATQGGGSASAYITYLRPEDCLRAIHAVSNRQVDGRTLKASLGTTKYCSHFLKGTHCPKQDCMYLHELGEEAASFTKDEMQANKHHDYELKLAEMYLNCSGASSATPAASSQQPPPHCSHQSSTTPPLVGQRVNLSSTPPQSAPPTAGNVRKKSEPAHAVALESSRDPPESWLVPTSTVPSCLPGGGDKRPASAMPVVASSRPPDTAPSTSGRHAVRPLSTGDGKGDKPALGNSNTNCGRSSPPSTSALLKDGSSVSSLPDASRLSVAPVGRDAEGKVNTAESPPPAFSTAAQAKVAAYKDSSTSHDSLFSDYRRLKISSQTTTSSLAHPVAESVAKVNEHGVPRGGSVDWQAAFGFATAKDSLQADDDLGFDPWNESSKALADLMAKELGGNSDNGSSSVHCSMNQCLPQPHTNGIVGSRQVSLVVPPPHAAQQAANFTTPQALYRRLNAFAELQTPPGIARIPMHSAQSLPHQPDAFSMKDWQEGLKALLPNVPINFGVPPFARVAEVSPQPSSRSALMGGQLHRSWNGVDRKADNWTDPAIILSATVAEPDASLHGSPPHWMRSIQQLTESPSSGELALSLPVPTEAQPAVKLSNSRLPFVHNFPPPGTNGWPPMQTHNPPPGFHHQSAPAGVVYLSAGASASSQTAHIQRLES